jgi:pimeloyl-ACP methyl ester carboxylesterase
MTDQHLGSSSIAAQRRELWVTAPGARLFAVELGAGPPVVLLHGGLADHGAVLSRFGALAGSCRLVAPDLRGSGRSHYQGELTWALLADDLTLLLDALGIERAVLGGMSMGSAVAVRFALRHPSRLRALVLMSPLYAGADRPLSEAASSAMRTMEQAGELALERGVEALRPLFDALPQPVRRRAVEMMLRFDPVSVAATTRFLARAEQPLRSASELASIDVPVMLLPGLDPQHPAEVAELYAQHLRDVSVVEQTSPQLLDELAKFCGGRAPAL